MRAALLTILTGLATAGSAAAQTADPCASFKWPVTLEKQAFTGAQYPGLMAGATVALDPQDRVAYPVPPTHKPKNSPAYGAVVAGAPLAEGGTYQITLSDEAWIDVVQNGKIIRSSAFSGAEGCPGIRKSVRFNLDHGPLTIELSDAKAERVNIDMLPAQAQ